LIVLHVLPTGTYEIVNLAQLGQGESAQQFEDGIRRELQELQPPDDRVPMEYKLAKGDPAASIIQVAEETACDLIVLGTHGRTGLRRVLMGSVAEHVMRSAPCPVLVVKGSGAGADLSPAAPCSAEGAGP
jgi:nucleotide-binding universal stress UspA family protein